MYYFYKNRTILSWQREGFQQAPKKKGKRMITHLLTFFNFLKESINLYISAYPGKTGIKMSNQD